MNILQSNFKKGFRIGNKCLISLAMVSGLFGLLDVNHTPLAQADINDKLLLPYELQFIPELRKQGLTVSDASSITYGINLEVTNPFRKSELQNLLNLLKPEFRPQYFAISINTNDNVINNQLFYHLRDPHFIVNPGNEIVQSFNEKAWINEANSVQKKLSRGLIYAGRFGKLLYYYNTNHDHVFGALPTDYLVNSLDWPDRASSELSYAGQLQSNFKPRFTRAEPHLFHASDYRAMTDSTLDYTEPYYWLSSLRRLVEQGSRHNKIKPFARDGYAIARDSNIHRTNIKDNILYDSSIIARVVYVYINNLRDSRTSLIDLSDTDVFEKYLYNPLLGPLNITAWHAVSNIIDVYAKYEGMNKNAFLRKNIWQKSIVDVKSKINFNNYTSLAIPCGILEFGVISTDPGNIQCEISTTQDYDVLQDDSITTSRNLGPASNFIRNNPVGQDESFKHINAVENILNSYTTSRIKIFIPSSFTGHYVFLRNESPIGDIIFRDYYLRRYVDNSVDSGISSTFKPNDDLYIDLSYTSRSYVDYLSNILDKNHNIFNIVYNVVHDLEFIPYMRAAQLSLLNYTAVRKTAVTENGEKNRAFAKIDSANLWLHKDYVARMVPDFRISSKIKYEKVRSFISKEQLLDLKNSENISEVLFQNIRDNSDKVKFRYVEIASPVGPVPGEHVVNVPFYIHTKSPLGYSIINTFARDYNDCDFRIDSDYNLNNCNVIEHALDHSKNYLSDSNFKQEGNSDFLYFDEYSYTRVLPYDLRITIGDNSDDQLRDFLNINSRKFFISSKDSVLSDLYYPDTDLLNGQDNKIVTLLTERATLLSYAARQITITPFQVSGTRLRLAPNALFVKDSDFLSAIKNDYRQYKSHVRNEDSSIEYNNFVKYNALVNRGFAALDNYFAKSSVYDYKNMTSADDRHYLPLFDNVSDLLLNYEFLTRKSYNSALQGIYSGQRDPSDSKQNIYSLRTFGPVRVLQGNITLEDSAATSSWQNYTNYVKESHDYTLYFHEPASARYRSRKNIRPDLLAQYFSNTLSSWGDFIHVVSYQHFLAYKHDHRLNKLCDNNICPDIISNFDRVAANYHTIIKERGDSVLNYGLGSEVFKIQPSRFFNTPMHGSYKLEDKQDSNNLYQAVSSLYDYVSGWSMKNTNSAMLGLYPQADPATHADGAHIHGSDAFLNLSSSTKRSVNFMLGLPAFSFHHLVVLPRSVDGVLFDASGARYHSDFIKSDMDNTADDRQDQPIRVAAANVFDLQPDYGGVYIGFADYIPFFEQAEVYDIYNPEFAALGQLNLDYNTKLYAGGGIGINAPQFDIVVHGFLDLINPVNFGRMAGIAFNSETMINFADSGVRHGHELYQNGFLWDHKNPEDVSTVSVSYVKSKPNFSAYVIRSNYGRVNIDSHIDSVHWHQLIMGNSYYHSNMSLNRGAMVQIIAAGLENNSLSTDLLNTKLYLLGHNTDFSYRNPRRLSMTRYLDSDIDNINNYYRSKFFGGAIFTQMMQSESGKESALSLIKPTLNFAEDAVQNIGRKSYLNPFSYKLLVGDKLFFEQNIFFVVTGTNKEYYGEIHDTDAKLPDFIDNRISSFDKLRVTPILYTIDLVNENHMDDYNQSPRDTISSDAFPIRFSGYNVSLKMDNPLLVQKNVQNLLRSDASPDVFRVNALSSITGSDLIFKNYLHEPITQIVRLDNISKNIYSDVFDVQNKNSDLVYIIDTKSYSQNNLVKLKVMMPVPAVLNIIQDNPENYRTEPLLYYNTQPAAIFSSQYQQYKDIFIDFLKNAAAATHADGTMHTDYNILAEQLLSEAEHKKHISENYTNNNWHSSDHAGVFHVSKKVQIKGVMGGVVTMYADMYNSQQIGNTQMSLSGDFYGQINIITTNSVLRASDVIPPHTPSQDKPPYIPPTRPATPDLSGEGADGIPDISGGKIDTIPTFSGTSSGFNVPPGMSGETETVLIPTVTPGISYTPVSSGVCCVTCCVTCCASVAQKAIFAQSLDGDHNHQISNQFGSQSGSNNQMAGHSILQNSNVINLHINTGSGMTDQSYSILFNDQDEMIRTDSDKRSFMLKINFLPENKVSISKQQFNPVLQAYEPAMYIETGIKDESKANSLLQSNDDNDDVIIRYKNQYLLNTENVKNLFANQRISHNNRILSYGRVMQDSGLILRGFGGGYSLRNKHKNLISTFLFDNDYTELEGNSVPIVTNHDHETTKNITKNAFNERINSDYLNRIHKLINKNKANSFLLVDDQLTAQMQNSDPNEPIANILRKDNIATTVYTIDEFNQAFVRQYPDILERLGLDLEKRLIKDCDNCSHISNELVLSTDGNDLYIFVHYLREVIGDRKYHTGRYFVINKDAIAYNRINGMLKSVNLPDFSEHKHYLFYNSNDLPMNRPASLILELSPLTEIHETLIAKPVLPYDNYKSNANYGFIDLDLVMSAWRGSAFDDARIKDDKFIPNNRLRNVFTFDIDGFRMSGSLLVLPKYLLPDSRIDSNTLQGIYGLERMLTVGFLSNHRDMYQIFLEKLRNISPLDRFSNREKIRNSDQVDLDNEKWIALRRYLGKLWNPRGLQFADIDSGKESHLYRTYGRVQWMQDLVLNFYEDVLQHAVLNFDSDFNQESRQYLLSESGFGARWLLFRRLLSLAKTNNKDGASDLKDNLINYFDAKYIDKLKFYNTSYDDVLSVIGSRGLVLSSQILTNESGIDFEKQNHKNHNRWVNKEKDGVYTYDQNYGNDEQYHSVFKEVPAYMLTAPGSDVIFQGRIDNPSMDAWNEGFDFHNHVFRPMIKFKNAFSVRSINIEGTSTLESLIGDISTDVAIPSDINITDLATSFFPGEIQVLPNNLGKVVYTNVNVMLNDAHLWDLKENKLSYTINSLNKLDTQDIIQHDNGKDRLHNIFRYEFDHTPGYAATHFAHGRVILPTSGHALIYSDEIIFEPSTEIIIYADYIRDIKHLNIEDNSQYLSSFIGMLPRKGHRSYNELDRKQTLNIMGDASVYLPITQHEVVGTDKDVDVRNDDLMKTMNNTFLNFMNNDIGIIIKSTQVHDQKSFEEYNNTYHNPVISIQDHYIENIKINSLGLFQFDDTESEYRTQIFYTILNEDNNLALTRIVPGSVMYQSLFQCNLGSNCRLPVFLEMSFMQSNGSSYYALLLLSSSELSDWGIFADTTYHPARQNLGLYSSYTHLAKSNRHRNIDVKGFYLTSVDDLITYGRNRSLITRVNSELLVNIDSAKNLRNVVKSIFDDIHQHNSSTTYSWKIETDVSPIMLFESQSLRNNYRYSPIAIYELSRLQDDKNTQTALIWPNAWAFDNHVNSETQTISNRMHLKEDARENVILFLTKLNISHNNVAGDFGIGVFNTLDRDRYPTDRYLHAKYGLLKDVRGDNFYTDYDHNVKTKTSYINNNAYDNLETFINACAEYGCFDVNADFVLRVFQDSAEMSVLLQSMVKHNSNNKHEHPDVFYLVENLHHDWRTDIIQLYPNAVRAWLEEPILDTMFINSDNFKMINSRDASGTLRSKLAFSPRVIPIFSGHALAEYLYMNMTSIAADKYYAGLDPLVPRTIRRLVNSKGQMLSPVEFLLEIKKSFPYTEYRGWGLDWYTKSSANKYRDELYLTEDDDPEMSKLTVGMFPGFVSPAMVFDFLISGTADIEKDDILILDLADLGRYVDFLNPNLFITDTYTCPYNNMSSGCDDGYKLHARVLPNILTNVGTSDANPHAHRMTDESIDYAHDFMQSTASVTYDKAISDRKDLLQIDHQFKNTALYYHDIKTQDSHLHIWGDVKRYNERVESSSGEFGSMLAYGNIRFASFSSMDNFSRMWVLRLVSKQQIQALRHHNLLFRDWVYMHGDRILPEMNKKRIERNEKKIRENHRVLPVNVREIVNDSYPSKNMAHRTLIHSLASLHLNLSHPSIKDVTKKSVLKSLLPVTLPVALADAAQNYSFSVNNIQELQQGFIYAMTVLERYNILNENARLLTQYEEASALQEIDKLPFISNIDKMINLETLVVSGIINPGMGSIYDLYSQSYRPNVFKESVRDLALNPEETSQQATDADISVLVLHQVIVDKLAADLFDVAKVNPDQVFRYDKYILPMRMWLNVMPSENVLSNEIDHHSRYNRIKNSIDASLTLDTSHKFYDFLSAFGSRDKVLINLGQNTRNKLKHALTLKHQALNTSVTDTETLITNHIHQKYVSDWAPYVILRMLSHDNHPILLTANKDLEEVKYGSTETWSDKLVFVINDSAIFNHIKPDLSHTEKLVAKINFTKSFLQRAIQDNQALDPYFVASLIYPVVDIFRSLTGDFGDYLERQYHISEQDLDIIQDARTHTLIMSLGLNTDHEKLWELLNKNSSMSLQKTIMNLKEIARKIRSIEQSYGSPSISFGDEEIITRTLDPNANDVEETKDAQSHKPDQIELDLTASIQRAIANEDGSAKISSESETDKMYDANEDGSAKISSESETDKMYDANEDGSAKISSESETDKMYDANEDGSAKISSESETDKMYDANEDGSAKISSESETDKMYDANEDGSAKTDLVRDSLEDVTTQIKHKDFTDKNLHADYIITLVNSMKSTLRQNILHDMQGFLTDHGRRYFVLSSQALVKNDRKKPSLLVINSLNKLHESKEESLPKSEYMENNSDEKTKNQNKRYWINIDEDDVYNLRQKDVSNFNVWIAMNSGMFDLPLEKLVLSDDSKRGIFGTYTNTRMGFLFGVDYIMSDSFDLGGFVGYQYNNSKITLPDTFKSNMRLNSLVSLDVNNILAGINVRFIKSWFDAKFMAYVSNIDSDVTSSMKIGIGSVSNDILPNNKKTHHDVYAGFALQSNASFLLTDQIILKPGLWADGIFDTSSNYLRTGLQLGLYYNKFISLKQDYRVFDSKMFDLVSLAPYVSVKLGYAFSEDVPVPENLKESMGNFTILPTLLDQYSIIGGLGVGFKMMIDDSVEFNVNYHLMNLGHNKLRFFDDLNHQINITISMNI